MYEMVRCFFNYYNLNLSNDLATRFHGKGAVKTKGREQRTC